MKVKILIKDKEKGIIEIPLSKKEIHDIHDFGYMTSPDMKEDYFMQTLKLNKCDKTFWKLHEISGKIIDALYGGQTYILKGNRLVKSKSKPFYLYGKPKWKKEQEK